MTQNNFQIADNFHQNQTRVVEVNRRKVLVRKPERKINYEFFVHYHPYVDDLIEKLNRDGLLSFMEPVYLSKLVKHLDPDDYTPGFLWENQFPEEIIDVSEKGAYTVYNWELFFHAPVTIANHLSRNQRFAEAQRWYHFIFDPTSNDKSVDPPMRFWKFLQFRDETNPKFIQEMMLALSNPKDSELKTAMSGAIDRWRENPFRPHVIARERFLAYQINVVMKYLDNLLAWGDNLFRQYTIETLNEATQIYVLAANILGRKPQEIPPRGKRTPKTYAQLKAKGIDKFGNALIQMENDFPFYNIPKKIRFDREIDSVGMFGIGDHLYFCIPQNDKLLEYWDKVADRLFKIRHCMDIEGVVRQLALFEPPIDPGMLVRAVAAGLDIASIVNNINQPLSNVRGPLLLQKAQEICSELKALGSAMLTAIEKKEAEHLSLLRQQHELNILNLTKDVKYLQWKESEAATAALIASRNTVFEKYKHYKMILGIPETDTNKLKSVELVRKQLTEDTFNAVYSEWVDKYGQELQREAYRQENTMGGLMEFAGNAVTNAFNGQLGKTLPLNKNENAELNIYLPTADSFNTLSMALRIAAPILGLIPQFEVSCEPLGIGAGTTFGGKQLKQLAKDGAEILKEVAGAFTSSAERASKLASYYRRAEDYVFQANLATSELQQYGRQIISSLIREQITKREYENHLKQIEQSEAVDAFMNEKFTGEELYSWMQGELSKIYFESYKLTFDIAKRAEQTMKHELMRKEFDEMNFIKFGYWDSAREGLLAGETLALDLKRLEMAYHDQNLREFEITKHVSLARLDPIALLKLKITGSCEITIPEWLYDLDSPGQFMRRIKTVAVSIPCIVGPYTGIHCKMSLLRSSIRTSSLTGSGYGRLETGDDSRFRDFTGAIQSIVTSTAQNDNGLFELNLKDERYLPFEGAGAISTWKIELPNDFPQFDHDTISDMIIHIRYTAREGGQIMRTDAKNFINSVGTRKKLSDSLLQLFCLNHDFPAAWQGFVSANDDSVKKLELTVLEDQFPYWAKAFDFANDLIATFWCKEWTPTKKQLKIAPKTVSSVVNKSSPWTIKVENIAPNIEVFNFLKMYSNKKIYMTVQYI